MQDLIRRGVINPETLVWHEGQAGWLPVRVAVGKPGVAATADAAPPVAGVPAAAVPPPQPVAAELSAPAPAPAVPAGPAPKPPKKCDYCKKKTPPEDLSREGEFWICATCRMEAFRRQHGGGMMRLQVAQFYAAGFWIRVLARIIDGLIVGFFQGIIMVLLGLKNPLMGLRANADPAAVINASAALMQSSLMLVQLGLGVLYEVLFLGFLGATPGKLALGLKVITTEGEDIGLFRAFFRYLALNFCGLCGFGYLMAAFTENKRALHDMVCGTRVVHR
jgi:uncharacterized RDD family membrane protein YckC